MKEIINLLNEVINEHRDSDDNNYNECDIDGEECQWCIEARAGIEKLEKEERFRKEGERLWSLLDDISTLGDMYKPNIDGYFNAVNKVCDRRNGMFYSDGCKIFNR